MGASGVGLFFHLEYYRLNSKISLTQFKQYVVWQKRTSIELHGVET
jgi:hypothetical protein